MDEQVINMVKIDYVYMVSEDNTENHFYDVFVEFAGVRRIHRIRVATNLSYIVEHLIHTLLRTLMIGEDK
jgi:hypothetical protein